MAARIYSDKDADLSPVKGKDYAPLLALVPDAHALNLHDSGIQVIVALPPEANRALARGHGLKVYDTGEAVRRADIIFLGLPDTPYRPSTKKKSRPNLRTGQTILFAHGFAIQYRTIVPKGCRRRDGRPKGLGPMVRREFVEKRGVPGLFAIRQRIHRAGQENRLNLGGEGNWLSASRTD